MASADSVRRGLGPVLLRWLLASLLWPGMAPVQADEPEPTQLQARTIEPRAFGIRVGDVVERQIVIDVPNRLTLDETSLPVVGPQGPVLELRALGRSVEATPTGRRLSLALKYQVFAAPVAVRSYELPKLLLRFDGVPRGDELRVEPWPLVVSALAAEDASPREGLGDLRPDIAPPLRDVAFERGLLQVCAALAAALGAYLALVYWGLPWWGRRHRPFTQAFKTVQEQRGADGREACRALHAAFNETAGRTVFAGAVDSFVAQVPRFAGLRDDIHIFFERSQAAFYADSAQAQDPAPDWLLAFARACRDAERGSGATPSTASP